MLSKDVLIMVISHDLELLLEVCTHILEISNGNIKDSYRLDKNNIGRIKDFFEK